MLYTVIKMSFGTWLKEQRKQAGLTLKQLAARCGVSFSYISALERGQPHSITGKDIRPKQETVDAIARALGKALDEARLAAGYAPAKPFTKPATIEELADALNALGLPVPQAPFPQGVAQTCEDARCRR